MRNRFKLAAGGVGVAAVAASVVLTGGTSAYFYDLEKSTGNQIEACDFDLTWRSSNLKAVSQAPSSQASATRTNGDGFLNGADGAFTLANLQPGDAYSVQLNVRNAGSCAGELYMDVDQHVDLENRLTEPEAAAGDADQSGDIGETVQAKVRLDGYKTLHEGSLASFAEALPTLLDDDFAGKDEHSLVVTFAVPESGTAGTENVIMTDSYSFDLDFAVTQKGHAPTGNLG